MKFVKNNFKIIVVAIVGVFVQILIIGSIIIYGNKEKANIERMDRQDVTDSYYFEPSYDEELDSIEESKKSKYNRNSQSIETTKEDGEKNIEEDLEAIKTGKVDVDLKFTPSSQDNADTSKGLDRKVQDKSSTNNTSNKPKNETVKKDKNEELKKDIEKTKKIAIGTWKSVNDSDGKFEDVYMEFFSDGSYKKYNESRNIVYTGKYTFTSASKIKMNYETIKLSNVDDIKEEKETFTADINFKDDKSFSVTDIKRFDFSNYKKIK